jgi:hypothetical protein
MQCWQDIAQFQQFLMAMLSQMGPYPMQGITDGSQAIAGNIGEVAHSVVAGTFPVTANNVQTISAIVLSPGDWDVSATCDMQGAATTGSDFALTPVPTGVLDQLSAVAAVSTGVEDTSLHSGVTQANIKVPTLLAFQLTTNITGAGAAAGTFNFTTFARRRR